MKYLTAATVAALALGCSFSRGLAQESSTYIQSDDQVKPNSETVPRLQLDRSPHIQPEAYTLGAGDRVFVNIFGLPEYSKDYRVLADGTLNLPLIGSVLVEGLTLTQASRELERQYQTYLQRPVVTLDLQRPRPLQIAIAGEVDRPGTYNIAVVERDGVEDEEQKITVTQVIREAGGITQRADIRNIQVYRPAPDGIGSGAYMTANLWKLLQDGDISEDIVLRDRDSIIVPEAAVIDNSEVTEIASANFSPDTMNVYVVGEVGDPGLVEVEPNAPMNQALLAAGGFDLVRAARGSVRLVRLNPDGTVSDRRISVDLSASVNEETNPALQPNDTILVRRSGFTSFSDTMNQLLSPFNGVFNFIRVLQD